jgi:dihydroneopterin aldolase
LFVFIADRILVEGITFYGHHGVEEAERAVGGRYRVDLVLFRDLAAAGKSDRLADTTNYADVVRLVVRLGTTRRFRLLEAFAETLAGEILASTAVDGATVRVTKLHPPVAELAVGAAAVELTRWRPGRHPSAMGGS